MTDSDQDVARAVRRGDREAFAHLLRKYQGRLFGLVLMMVRDRAGAEEVTQDAFVRAYTHIGHYDDARPFYPWLATIATRLAQNWLRHHQRTIRREGTSLEDAAEPATKTIALNELVADERSRELWEAVEGLSSGGRTAVILYYRDNVAIRDIAQALGVTTGTIKTLLFRARQQLRRRLTRATSSVEDPT